MTDDKLPFPTTDAMEWVRAFRETFPDANVDDGTMLGWFANAIEHGRGPAVPALDERKEVPTDAELATAKTDEPRVTTCQRCHKPMTLGQDHRCDFAASATDEHRTIGERKPLGDPRFPGEYIVTKRAALHSEEPTDDR